MQYFKKYYIVYVLTIAFVLSAAYYAREDITAYLSTAAELTVPATTVVIDPGHGGEDGGAVGRSGVPESTLNLEIGLRLNDLCMLLGIPTKMIRTEDVAVYTEGAHSISEKKVSDLKNRADIVNHTPGALLISIHQNSFPEERYAGAQVFFADTEGSEALAELLQERIDTILDPNNRRKCKPCQTVYLMEHIQCTGILLECGFLTNADEEMKLRTPAYQKQLVCTVISALTEFLATAADRPV